jgi:ankyrin repeat protein
VTAKEANKEPQESDSDETQGQMFTRLKKKDAVKKETNALRVNKRNERGETLLHLASIKGDTDETIALIKAGIIVNAKDYAGEITVYSIRYFWLWPLTEFYYNTFQQF